MRKVLYWLAGGDARLYDCDELRDANQTMVMRGALQLAVAIIAGASGSAAASFFINSLAAVAAVGLAWGFFILLLDSCLVRAVTKLEGRSILFFRIGMSMLIAVLVSIPIEVVIFRGPIMTALASRDQKYAQRLNGELIRQFPQIGELRREIALRNTFVEEQRKIVQRLADEVIKEIEGKSPTGMVGHGPAWREKQANLQEARKELAARENEAAAKNAFDETKVKALEADKEGRRAVLLVTQASANGLSDRVRALYELERRDAGIGIFAWLIRLLLVCIELSPLMLKLTSRVPLHEEAVQIEDETGRLNLKIQAKWRRKWASKRRAAVSREMTAVLKQFVKTAGEQVSMLAIHAENLRSFAITLSESTFHGAKEVIGNKHTRPVSDEDRAQVLDELKNSLRTIGDVNKEFAEVCQKLDVLFEGGK